MGSCPSCMWLVDNQAPAAALVAGAFGSRVGTVLVFPHVGLLYANRIDGGLNRSTRNQTRMRGPPVSPGTPFYTPRRIWRRSVGFYGRSRAMRVDRIGIAIGAVCKLQMLANSGFLILCRCRVRYQDAMPSSGLEICSCDSGPIDLDLSTPFGNIEIVGFTQPLSRNILESLDILVVKLVTDFLDWFGPWSSAFGDSYSVGLLSCRSASRAMYLNTLF